MAYAEFNSTRNRIDVTTRYEEKELIKAVPGSRYHGEDKIWSVPATFVACLQLRGLFKDNLHIGDRLKSWAALERVDRIDQATALRTRLEPETRTNELLYPFQEAGQNFLAVAGSALLGDEMGTGKTIQLLATLKDEGYPETGMLPALVICPNSTKFNWQAETEKWFPDAHPYVITGGVVQRRKLLKAAKDDPNALVIINIEAVRSHSRLAAYGSIHLMDNEKTQKELNEIPFRTVVFDEAHRMKDPKSKQTRAAWYVAHQETVKHRYALTGTPIANDPSDLWSILHFLAPDEHPTKSKFIDRYCLLSWNAYGGLSVIGVQPETRDEFRQVIGARFRRVTKAEVLTQLPTKQRQLVRVQMTPKQAKAYRDMEVGLATRVDSGIIVASTNLVAQIRLLQFAGSTCDVDDEGLVTPVEPSPKIDALMDIIDAAQGKPIVACAVQRKLIELASKRLDKEKISHGLITGKVDEWTRKQNLKKFQDGELPVLLFTIQAGGTGLNMTAADTIVFIQRDWSMVNNLQAEDRVHRIGSEVHESINIIDIITDETVEEDVMRRYLEKVHRLDQITEDRARAHAMGLETSELDSLESFILKSHLGDAFV
jgi:SNF2 family DNA or RNA helicase